MSGFMLNMLEDMLNLTAEEKAAIEPALPHLKTVVDAVNAHQDSLEKLVPYVVRGAPVFTRILQDWRTLGPAASGLLGDAMIDVGGAVGAAKDIQATVQANQAYVNQGTALYNSLVPVINTVQAEWPKLEPAVKIITNAMGRKKMGSAVEFVGALHEHLSKQMQVSGSTGADAGIVRGSDKQP